MKLPRFSPAQLDQILNLSARYVESQRQRYLLRSQPLSSDQIAAMTGFFRPTMLQATRIALIPGERVANPDFYPILKIFGFSGLPDFSSMEACCFIDVIVAPAPISNAYLFRELVYMELYRQLGAVGVSDRYVKGFVSSGHLAKIPTEQIALELNLRYTLDPETRFSVPEEIARYVAEGRL